MGQVISEGKSRGCGRKANMPEARAENPADEKPEEAIPRSFRRNSSSLPQNREEPCSEENAREHRKTIVVDSERPKSEVLTGHGHRLTRIRFRLVRGVCCLDRQLLMHVPDALDGGEM